MTEEMKNVTEESEQPDGQLSMLDQLPAEETETVMESPVNEDAPAEEEIASASMNDEEQEEAPAVPMTEEPKDAPPVLTKKELKAQKKAEKKAKRRERRDNRVGVPVWYVILLIIGINAFWYWHIEYKYEPKVQANYDKYEAVIEEYKRQIKVQDIIWRNREEYWQKEAEQINEKADQLQANYEIIMRDLGFEIDENGNAYKPE